MCSIEELEALVAGREKIFLTWLFEHYAYRPDRVAIDEYIRAYEMSLS